MFHLKPALILPTSALPYGSFFKGSSFKGLSNNLPLVSVRQGPSWRGLGCCCLAGWMGLASVNSMAAMQPLSDFELQATTAQLDLPGLPNLADAGFNIQQGGIEIDLDVQASIGSVQWRDEDGYSSPSGEGGEAGALILKGVHIGGSDTPITAEQVRNATPFQPSDLAMIHGMLVEADPQKGTLITINKLGDTQGNGVDVIVNDIYFGKDLSAQGIRGTGLLLEDISNFVQDGYVEQINSLFNLQLTTVDDGFGTVGGNYYPLQIRMQPIEGALSTDPVAGLDPLESGLTDITGIPGLGSNSMIIDAQFLLYIDKIALFRDNWQAGIEGFMVYQGIDTNQDGMEDTIGPVSVTGLKMQTIQHPIAEGKTVQAMHFSNIDINMDIAMANLYIGNPQTGSLGAVHINDLHIHDTQMWIYAHD